MTELRPLIDAMGTATTRVDCVAAQQAFADAWDGVTFSDITLDGKGEPADPVLADLWRKYLGDMWKTVKKNLQLVAPVPVLPALP